MYEGKFKFLTVFLHRKNYSNKHISLEFKISTCNIVLWEVFKSQSKMARFSVVFQNPFQTPVLTGEFKFSNYGVVFLWDLNVSSGRTLRRRGWNARSNSARTSKPQRRERRPPGVCAPRTAFSQGCVPGAVLCICPVVLPDSFYVCSLFYAFRHRAVSFTGFCVLLGSFFYVSLFLRLLAFCVAMKERGQKSTQVPWTESVGLAA